MCDVCDRCSYNTTIDFCPLHSAAPELLEALQFMLEHRELQLAMSGTTRKSEDIERAKAAIAKATEQGW